MQQNKRIVWVDIAKGIGILLVLIGHISQNPYISSFIYCFHMPLFFIISGYLYKDKPQYIRKKMKTILLPYLFFAIISFVYWYFIERNIRGQTVNPINIFLNIWLARGGNDNYIFNVALWFLPCLLIVEIVFHSLIKRIKSIKHLSVVMFIFSILGYAYAKLDLIRLPFCIDVALTAIVFYFFGYCWKNKLESNFIKFNKIRKSILFCICLLVTIILSQLITSIDMNNLQYPFYIFLYILPIFGFLIIYIISTSIKQNKILQYLGTNTLIIMGVHEPIKRALIEIIHRILNISIEMLRKNFLGIIFVTIILTLICIPIIFIIKRYLPFLIGRKKEKEYVNY